MSSKTAGAMGKRGGNPEPLAEQTDLGHVDSESFYRVAVAACNGARNADEIADEAVVRYVTSYKGKSMSSAHRLIRSIVARIRIDEWRNALSAKSISTDPAKLQIQVVCNDTPEDLAVNAELVGAVRLAVSELPPHLQEPLVLRVMQGMSTKEISQRIDVPVRTIENRVKAALERLRTKFKTHSIGAVSVSQVIQERVTLATAAPVVAVGATTAVVVRAALVALTFFACVIGLSWFQRHGGREVDPDENLAGLIRQPSSEIGPNGDDVAAASLALSERREGVVAGAIGKEGTTSPLPGASVETPASVGEGTDEEQGVRVQSFQIRIVLNGAPSAGWKSHTPLLDPDAQKTAGGDPIVCTDRPLTDEDGVAEFELPLVAGKWHFALESPVSPLLGVVVLLDPASVDGVLEIELETGELVLEEGIEHWPGYEISQLVLESNPQPGVWVLSSPQEEASEQGLVFPHVAIGRHRLRAFSTDQDPDQWRLATPRRTIQHDR